MFTYLFLEHDKQANKVRERACAHTHIHAHTQTHTQLTHTHNTHTQAAGQLCINVLGNAKEKGPKAVPDVAGSSTQKRESSLRASLILGTRYIFYFLFFS